MIGRLSDITVGQKTLKMLKSPRRIIDSLPLKSELTRPVILVSSLVLIAVVATLTGLTHADSNIFTTQTPAVTSANDNSSVELGVKFQSTVAGTVNGVRFYKGTGNNGTHIGNLWSSTGTLLATGTFTNETANGWQTLTFSSPVSIQANTTYVASYLAPTGHYSDTNNGFANAVSNPPLTALSSSTSGGNGVYKYSSSNVFPTQSYQASNYWVDVSFTANSNDVTPPTTSITSPTDGSTVSSTTNITATASDNVGVTKVEFYVDNSLVSTSTTFPYSYSWDTTTVSNGSHILETKAYDAAGNVGTSPTVTVTVNNPTPPPPTVGLTIFPSGSAPMLMDANDTKANSGMTAGIKFTTDTAGVVNGIRFYKGNTSNTGTHIGSLWTSTGTLLASTTFTSETATGWQTAAFSSPVSITPGTTYVASYFTPTGHYSATAGGLTYGYDNSPLHAVPGKNSSGISVNGLYNYGSTNVFPTQSFMGGNYWVDVNFTATGVPPAASSPRPGVNGSGPILVLTDPDNHFTDYLSQILNAEGIHEFATTDAGNLGNTVDPTSYSQIIIGDTTLTDSQVSLLSTWVNNGGTLIALHPKANLDSLLGLVPANSSLSDGYIAVDGSQAPGQGITTATMQYHGSADEYTLTGGARAVAALYSDATTSTPYSAISYRQVGSGQAMAFSYDLARSIIYTRQGNPAWQGQARDGTTVSLKVRSDNLFFGNASYDPETDYVNLNKVIIPQADEQQRLLVNGLNMSASPLPRLNYLPNGLPAAVVMTGDGHPGVATQARFNEFLAQDPPNCSNADWTCYRYTAYDNVLNNAGAQPGGLTDALAAQYQAEGFEYALHTSTNCADFNPFNLDSKFFTPQLQWFAQNYPDIATPTTNRTHCIPWDDYSTLPLVELAHGMRLDTNYYYWPGGGSETPVNWTQQRPGYFTGSGLPQRFATINGSTIDVFQAATQMPDESGITDYNAFISPMLDNAINSGYTAVITTNCHMDAQGGNSEACATKALAAAKARNIPVITAKQELQWLDARNNSTVTNYTWANNQLSFVLGSPAHNLQLMVPVNVGSTALNSLTVNAQAVSYTTSTIHGVTYALINAAATGTYIATYQ